MAKVRSWNVSSHFCAELTVGTNEDGERFVLDEYNDKLIPELIGVATQDCEMVIHFNSEGYHDPGSMYGGPDNLGYPPECEDNRTLDLIVLSTGIVVPKAIQDKIFDQYQKLIDLAPISEE